MADETSPRPRGLGERWRTPEGRTTIATALIAFGLVVLLQHLVSHMGFFTVFSGSVDDVLIGYPTAGVLIVAGLMMLGKTDQRSRR